MASTSAERQAAYRARHLEGSDAPSKQLAMVISAQAKSAMEELASRFQVTQRELLEHLLIQTKSAATTLQPVRATLGSSPEAQACLSDISIRLKPINENGAAPAAIQAAGRPRSSKRDNVVVTPRKERHAAKQPTSK